MKAKVMVSLFLVAGVLLGTTLSGFTAETYPSKPVRLVVPFTPGGGTDIVARSVGQWLTKKWGQQVIIDNRPGGTTIVGTEIVSKSPADGYTLLLASITFSINPGMMKKLPYDPLKAFIPITQTTFTPYLLAVHPSLPVRSVEELMASLRSKPDVKLKYGSSGTGGGQHLAGELFKMKTGIKNLVHVSYRGTGPAITDLLGGHIQVMFSTILSMIEHVKTGTLRGLAVSGAKRVASIPNLPTIAESGVPGYEASSWNGIMVPAGVPAHIVSTLNRDIAQALRSKEVKAVLEMDGAEVVGGTPEEFGRLVRSEIQKWGDVLRMAGVAPE
jgi:tripartite-type tricarboxylate transporter receptor subunit TctC